MHSSKTLSVDSIREASHVILGTYFGAADIYVVLDSGQPRTNFAHIVALPGQVFEFTACV